MPVSFCFLLNSAISSSVSGLAFHWLLFLVKIWMVAQPTSLPEMKALNAPPAMDMWAPIKGSLAVILALFSVGEDLFPASFYFQIDKINLPKSVSLISLKSISIAIFQFFSLFQCLVGSSFSYSFKAGQFWLSALLMAFSVK